MLLLRTDSLPSGEQWLYELKLDGLTKAKMAEGVWLTPVLVGQFEFLEWTGENHLRHSRFIGLRDDKNARDVHRE